VVVTTPKRRLSALHGEVAPFGIHTTVVNPGFFRTDLISERSMNFADASLARTRSS